ncbi:type II secretion system protein M [Pseudomonas tohonis]|uniref:type II secretion system protein M n=1 Tax=Pseudomonas tohonis TaxID=2725477 RepID=UPI0021DB36A0|nr:type II secretion system protein M [Pseudomonas tohonis]UXY55746.1 type II secretion system protein M [Pseudomonas tohonis]
MNERLQRLLSAWHLQRAQPLPALGPRDRRILRLAAIALPPMLLWYALIEPPLARIEHWQAELPRLRAQAQTLEAVLAEVQGPAALAPGASLESLLRQGLDGNGLAGHYQLHVDGPRWQLELQGAPAQGVMDWLLGVTPGLPLELRQVRLRRDGGTESERTDARLSGVVGMEQAPGAKESS